MREAILVNTKVERRPNWWRGSDSDDILDPYFKKPIYTGKSKFNFLPKFLKDNINWFKNKISSNITYENSKFIEYDKKTVLEFSKQQKMSQGQESSRYKYISPYSEYLLERLKWKIALRIYYTLDPNDKGYIELEHSKKLLFDMLKVDTEKAQTLLLLLETIKPFYAKDGCIEKNDILSYLAREIFDDTRGYGLFSKLNNIFKNPISRSKNQINDCFSNIFQGAYISNKNERMNFSSDPNVIKLDKANFRQNNLKETNHNYAHCQNKNETCVTCNMKKNCTGQLKDHIKMSEDRKKKFIERIKQEQKKINDESMLECTFKPEIIWPIGRFIYKNNKNWLDNKKNMKRSNLPRDKKNEICGYEIINEQDVGDKNIQVFLNNRCNFDSLNNWNGYIHDSMANQIYIIHKGCLMDDKNVDRNEIFYRKADKEDQKEIRNKVLDSIIRKIHAEFQNLENTESGNEQKNPLNFGKKKLIERLRTERESGTNDPRLNTPEFTIEVNHPMFVEKTVDFSEIKTYKNVVNHENSEIKGEYSTSPCYYYLPKGYERIGNCFNEIRFRRKLDFFYDKEQDNRNINKDNISNPNGQSNLFMNKKLDMKSNPSLYLDEKSVDSIKDKKIPIILNEAIKINSLSPRDSNRSGGIDQSKITKTQNLGELAIKNSFDKSLILKSSFKNDNDLSIIESDSINDKGDTRKECILATKFKKEVGVSILTKKNVNIQQRDSSMSPLKQEVGIPIPKQKDTSVFPLKKEAIAQIRTKNIKAPFKKDVSATSFKEETGAPILSKKNLEITPKKNILTASLKEETEAPILLKNLKIAPKKDSSIPSVKEEVITPILSNNLKISPKKNIFAASSKEETDTPIISKKSLKIAPNKNVSTTSLKEETDAPILSKNLKIASKKDSSIPSVKKEVTTLIMSKKNFKILPKKDLLIPSMKEEFKAPITTKNSLKISPKKDSSVSSIKKEVDTLILTKSLQIAPKNDFSTPLVKKEVISRTLSKNNLKIPPKKDCLILTIKEEAISTIPANNNPKIAPKKDKLLAPLKKEVSAPILLKKNLKIPEKKDNLAVPLK
ncbi:putative low complexity [Cryptosporidium sp. chipmunk genotype I]|uniref:putative low complexity n=1 Tax=Cryptosporidium sp. chipmunk genotype I TaxID=1280935 RepID=UPI00351A4D93|nr:putative low complexity [Cryptosporidium sp. chipmunk genotype I]